MPFERLDYRTHLRQRLVENHVPPTLHSGLIDNRPYLFALAAFLNHVPAPAWGSRAAVTAWLEDPAPVPEIFGMT